MEEKVETYEKFVIGVKVFVIFTMVILLFMGFDALIKREVIKTGFILISIFTLSGFNKNVDLSFENFKLQLEIDKLKEKTSENPKSESESDITCLQCDEEMKPKETKCNKCGWTYL